MHSNSTVTAQAWGDNGRSVKHPAVKLAREGMQIKPADIRRRGHYASVAKACPLTDQDDILIVDDDPAMLSLLTDILSDEGYRLRSANSGRLALQSLEGNPPKLILMDVNMPEMDGFEVCQRLKDQEESRNIPIIFISATQKLNEKMQGLELGAVDFIPKPFHADELLARVRNHLEMNHQRVSLEALVEERTQELSESIGQMRKILAQVVQALAITVESRDPYTAGHQRRVATLGRAIGKEMGLTKDQVDGIWMAGTIHDIGKISVPVEVLSKPTKLSELEFRLLKAHPQVGYDILKDIDFPWPIARMVLEHHERMDGSGYPRCLKGDDLLLESRILAVADVVESMTSHRPYRPGLGIDAALAEIIENRTILYDPNVVDVSLRLIMERELNW